MISQVETHKVKPGRVTNVNFLVPRMCHRPGILKCITNQKVPQASGVQSFCWGFIMQVWLIETLAEGLFELHL